LNGEGATEHSISNDVDNEDIENDVHSSGEVSNSDTAWASTMEGMTSNLNSMKRNVTFCDFTDVTNSVANLTLSHPSKELHCECLGVLVRMQDALSKSASCGYQPSVPLIDFMSSTDAFVVAFGPNAESRREDIFGPNAESRREDIFAPHAGKDPGNNFYMQRHNHYGKVRHKFRVENS
jgi:hypothetical protein